MLLLIFALLLIGSWSPMPQVIAEPRALSITVTFWPRNICGISGTVVPVGLAVSGEPDSQFEVSAWLYNEGQLGHVWSEPDGAWRWAHYRSITLDGNGSWSGQRYIQFKRAADLTAPYYLKAKVRNTTTSVEVKQEDWDLNDPASCLRVQGHVGNGSAPYAGQLIQMRNDSATVVAANLTSPTPWDSQDPAGHFQLMAQAGNHTLEVLDTNGTVLLSHRFDLEREALELELGWQATGDPDPSDRPLPANLSGRQLRITELAPDTYQPGDPDEYLALHNPTEEAVNLTGWSLTEDSATAHFPAHTWIGPDVTLRIALDGSAYANAWGQPPDLEMSPSTWRDGSDTPLSLMDGSPLRLSNSGEVVELLDPTNVPIDTVVYGEVTYYGQGWSWPPLEAPGTGRVLVRWSGKDTNSSIDWEDPWRVLKIGYSRWPIVTRPFQAGRPFVSPDSSYAALTGLIDDAASSLALNRYAVRSESQTSGVGDNLDA